MSEEILSDDELSTFRERCRVFLDEYATGIILSEPDPRDHKTMAQNKAFQGLLADAGLAGLTYPKEYRTLLRNRTIQFFRDSYVQKMLTRRREKYVGLIMRKITNQENTENNIRGGIEDRRKEEGPSERRREKGARSKGRKTSANKGATKPLCACAID